MAGDLGFIQEYTSELAMLAKNFESESILAAVKLLLKVYHNNGIVYIVGNGGSASTAQHFVQGLHDAGIRAVSLTDNTSSTTAIANDHGYKYIFSEQLEKFLTDKDLLVVITGSGNSQNILEAVTVAKKNNIPIVALLGFDGGKVLKTLTKLDSHILVDSNDYGIIEDLHLSLSHILSRMLGKQIKAEYRDK